MNRSPEMLEAEATLVRRAQALGHVMGPWRYDQFRDRYRTALCAKCGQSVSYLAPKPEDLSYGGSALNEKCDR